MARMRPEEAASSDLDATAVEDDAVADDAASVGANCVAARLSSRLAGAAAATAYSLSCRWALCVAFQRLEWRKHAEDSVAGESNTVLDSWSLLRSGCSSLHLRAMPPASVLQVNWP